MKKIILVFFGIAMLSLSGLYGCVDDEIPDKAEFIYSMNFYQDEYEEKYSKYEKALNVTKKSSEISVAGYTSSGKIDIQIISTDGDERTIYSYEIEGMEGDNDKIILEKRHPLNWNATVKHYEDTEGSFEISVK